MAESKLRVTEIDMVFAGLHHQPGTFRAIFILSTGWVVDHAPILTAAGLLAPLGTVVLLVLAGTISKLQLKS